MVMVYGVETNEYSLAAVDSDNIVFCWVERLDEMFASGLKFEALVAQMALVEAALHMYAGSVIQIGGLNIKVPTKATFGIVKKFIIDNKLIDDVAIVSKLEGYVADRNNLAHNLIVHYASYNFDAIYGVGGELIIYFRQYHLVEVMPIMRAFERIEAGEGESF